MWLAACDLQQVVSAVGWVQSCQSTLAGSSANDVSVAACYALMQEGKPRSECYTVSRS